ncbi:hypothetical protein HG537_0B07130 [Torulaspora globosa]|uniref:Uncharacterized protein n=1 Tax=Torulaspora globosa TaxID=48254 RepID=A0A7H9HPZ6_9SACH|nr:hypothetical protein HG537_0B07130 [Torulaspora sp. CBS 2947]
MSQENPQQIRFIAVGGFLLQAVKSDQRYKIVNFKYALRTMNEAEKKRLQNEELFDIDEYLSYENDLLDTSSKMLFEYIAPEQKDFYVDSETGAIKVVTGRTASAVKKSSATELVITITYPTNKKKYLRYSEALSAPTFTNPQDLFTDTLETDNSLSHLLFDIEGLVFTKADSEIMKDCYLNIGFYQDFCEKLMVRCYNVAQAQGNRSLMILDFTGKPRPLIKKFHSKTIKYYGRCIVPYVFMLLRIARLSAFAYYKREEGFTEIDSGRLLHDVVNHSPEDIDVTYWSQVCVDMLLAKDTLGFVLQTLLRCCAMEFENVNLDERREAKSPRHIRKSMDAFKAFLIFCTMSTASGHELFVENDGCDNWKWVKHLYTQAVKAEVNVDQYLFTTVPESQGVTIRGKLFNRQYICDFHSECRSRIESLIDKLNEYFFMPSVEDIACLILRNRSVSFLEPWPDMCSEPTSFYDLIPKAYQADVIPKLRQGNSGTEATKASVESVVNEVARLLVWMVYFGVGHPYRFPELRQLAFAGYQRNVFVDDKTRRLQLYSNYNKNKSSNIVLKTMDGVTSDYLFYFIVVLKQLQFWALGPKYKSINISVESRVLNDNVSPEVKSQRALRRYLFIDTTKGDLISYKSFRDVLDRLPEGERTRLNFRELRQAMCGVIRYYCNMTLEEQNDLHESLVHELMANHSVLTGFEVYAVNRFTTSSLTASGPQNLQMRASARYISWLGLEDAPDVEGRSSTESVTKTMDKKFMVSTEYRRYEDLEHAGRKAFGSDFAFRDESQRIITTDIYLGTLPSRVVQAPTGYGKTEMFRLPLIALASKKNCRYVSFVFVPYTVILADAMRRLKTRNLLRVNDVRDFIDIGYDGATDVYVGVFDDLSQTQFASRIAEWDYANSCRPGGMQVKLGYAIMDEFHNFDLEKYRKPRQLKALNF